MIHSAKVWDGMPTTNLYEKDLYSWAVTNAQFLRDKCVAELDFERLAEEIESMAISQKRTLQSRLEVLIAHLLKLQFLTNLKAQNERGWKITVREQRRRIAEVLEDSPSLKSHVESCAIRAYSYAVDNVVKQTDIDESIMPDVCPYSLQQILDDKFYPL